MHAMKNMGEVELATVSFGQSFQITPIQLATTVSSLINGGKRITPHFGVSVLNPDGTEGEKLTYPVKEGVVSVEYFKAGAGKYWKLWYPRDPAKMQRSRVTP